MAEECGCGPYSGTKYSCCRCACHKRYDNETKLEDLFEQIRSVVKQMKRAAENFD